MFKKLRNRLILINFLITTFVIVVIFTTIYTVSAKSAENRPPVFHDVLVKNEQSDEWENMISMNIREERKTAAEQLLVTLIVSGIIIELVVVFVSYFLAEEAIKPVKEAYSAQKIFIANASHEMKTPIAAISANLEAADIKNNKWIKNVEIETAKLATLNNDLLNLARTDLVSDSSQVIKTSEVNLAELVSKVLDRFESRLGRKKLTRKIDLDKKIKINAADFEQILSILMDNAVKYSDKSITVKLTEHTLIVSNDGKRIPNEKLPHIFDRFYQTDKSNEGVGLGLSIAKNLVEKNHWKLHVRSLKLTVFTLTF
ncbi:HAMP domain-containing histidine kinase [Candidatus Saccharibacteria bacterium]|nr:HAMP domain-containing histidine kinase [Candidatus Saccharibacteria bacterium]